MNRTDAYGDTPLCVAVLHQRVDVAREILEPRTRLSRQGDVARSNVRKFIEWTSHLFWRSKVRDVDQTPSVVDSEGEMLLHRAIVMNNMELLELLLPYTDLLSEDKFATIPFHRAVKQGNMDMVSRILEYGVTVPYDWDHRRDPYLDSRDRTGETILESARNARNASIVQYLERIARIEVTSHFSLYPRTIRDRVRTLCLLHVRHSTIVNRLPKDIVHLILNHMERNTYRYGETSKRRKIDDSNG